MISPAGHEPFFAVSTVDQIVAFVREQFLSRQTRARVELLHRQVRDALARRGDIQATWKKLLRERSGTRFYISLSHARKSKVSLGVRVSGVTCGYVDISDGRRDFSVPADGVAASLRALWRHEGPKDWASRDVRTYIDKARTVAREKYARRESAVEAHLIELMRKKRGKGGVLEQHQPVLFGGMPIQLPCWVTPRGRIGGFGKIGHIDVLARHLPGTLRLFEVKQPGARDSGHALGQAVMYAAALQEIMRDTSTAPLYWKLFGSGRSIHDAKFEAVAFVEDSVRNRTLLATAKAQLDRGNSAAMPLAAMFYQWKESSSGVRLEIDENPERR